MSGAVGRVAGLLRLFGAGDLGGWLGSGWRAAVFGGLVLVPGFGWVVGFCWRVAAGGGAPGTWWVVLGFPGRAPRVPGSSAGLRVFVLVLGFVWLGCV